ncbi:MAG: Brp/Blh family beta-carotene 15,15'-monooxygenase [Polaribacter sp.]|jgi:Brp/Blh family beta-carotene 15,15'-monooxygenase
MNRYFLENYQNFRIYFTFLLFWFSIQFGNIVEDSIAFFLVLTIGLIHGANDLLILSVRERGKHKIIKNIFIYVVISAVCVLMYWFNSYLALLLFILISSYHFGEEHLSDRFSINFYFDFVYFLSFGLIIFSMIFFTSLKEVNQIMLELTGIIFSKNQITLSLILSSSITVLLSVYLLLKEKLTIKAFGLELFYMMFLFLVFKMTSLILGFAIYFIFWHSIPSMMHQIIYISDIINNKSILFYIKKAAPFWAVSILGLILLFVALPEINIFSAFIFVLLFAVTAPHIWVMYKMKN